VVGVLATLVSGGSLVVEERFSRDRFWDVAQSFDVTWLNLVPAILANLAVPSAAGVSPGGGIRFARSASSPLSEAVRERFESAHGIGVLETYGMTEAASQITANPLRAEDRRSGSVGLPVGIELRVVDLDGDPVHDGATGVVQIRGPGVVGRYLAPGRIGATPACGIDGWFSTGDLGHRDRDGFVYLVGRTDDVINRGGEKVYPREIEEVLLRDRRVSEAVATARAHPSLGEQPVAYVTTALPADARAGLANDLQRSCELALSRYKRPAEIFVIDTLPVGATGKVARRRLAERSLVGGKP
jgi:acyl-CoA synthetase (AMP-forming)/AMP-acid ligase II